VKVRIGTSEIDNETVNRVHIRSEQRVRVESSDLPFVPLFDTKF